MPHFGEPRIKYNPLITRLHAQPSESAGANHWINSLAATRKVNVPTAAEIDAINLHYFPVPVKSRWDRIGLYVAGASLNPAARAYVVFYDDTGNLYPRNLLTQGGPYDVSVLGPKETVIDLTLRRGVYWLGYLTNDDGWNIGWNEYGLLPIGHTVCMGQHRGWWIANVYPAIPDPFPAAGEPADFYYSVGLRLAEVLEPV